jgi:uncharacterized membrane protein YhaH (DUF805 family)
MYNTNLIIVTAICGVLVIITIAGMWKTYQKAGQEGWPVLIPIYGTIILLRIIGKPWWWILLMCIPFIGFIWGIGQYVLLSKSFDKNLGFTLGLIFLPFIFFPILGFGRTKYEGPYGNQEAYDAYQRGLQSSDIEDISIELS